MKKILSLLLVVVVLSTMINTMVAKAAAITAMSDVQSSHTVSDAGVTHNLAFTVPGTITGTLTITFPVGFASVSVASVTSSACLDTFAAVGRVITADMTSCSGALTVSGVTATNPASAGSYSITIGTDNGSGQVNSGTLAIAISDSDTVTFSAQIAPSFTFDLAINTTTTYSNTASPYAIDLGTLSAGSVTNSGSLSTAAYINMKVDSNTNLGAAITIRGLGTNPTGLYSTVADYTIATTGGPTALSAGTEGYGFNVVAANATSSNTPVAASPFSSGVTGTVGGVTGTSQTLATIPAGDIINAATVSVEVSAAISAATPAANDYTHQARFIATGTF